ncbi:2'-5' RNA ligase [Micrococcus endophyticus]|uniref:2'-5' RNA ligase n=1 Tax=Micrococcus endophyticus TaxID=455343 RepID=A0A7W9N0A2_9MICC|nr:2'-5' RNA ligase [Micrococcus endophyticus]
MLDHLEPALDGVRDRAGRALRWTDPEQRHLTLAFHPEVPAGAVDDVVADAGRIAAGHAPLDLHLAGAGEFSHRTLWVGVGGQVRQLGALLAEPWLADDDGRDRRRAHLTVARVSGAAPRPRGRRRGEPRPPAPATVLLAEAVHALTVYRGPQWTADGVEVVASRLGEGRSGGPLHEVLATVPLRG